MVRYSLKDLKTLTGVLGALFPNNTNWWPEILEESIKSNKSLSCKAFVKRFLLEDVLSNYFGVISESPRFKDVFNFLFKTQLSNMPLYITSEKGWEKVISQWRLSIEK